MRSPNAARSVWSASGLPALFCVHPQEMDCTIRSAEHHDRMIAEEHSPNAILQAAFSFWSSKVLLTAVEFGLFTRLADRQLTGAELGAELKLHPRGIADFLDSLVAMKFVGRDGDGAEAKYFNTPETALFLDEKS